MAKSIILFFVGALSIVSAQAQIVQIQACHTPSLSDDANNFTEEAKESAIDFFHEKKFEPEITWRDCYRREAYPQDFQFVVLEKVPKNFSQESKEAIERNYAAILGRKGTSPLLVLNYSRIKNTAKKNSDWARKIAGAAIVTLIMNYVRSPSLPAPRQIFLARQDLDAIRRGVLGNFGVATASVTPQ